MRNIKGHGMERLISSTTEREAPQVMIKEDCNGHAMQRLSVASYNIQTGIYTSRYRHYLTRSWQHLFPTQKKTANLQRIAHFLSDFDLVGLQEVDSGGSRSSFIDQTEYLALHGGFSYWSTQVNRRFGKLALHSNGLLSRVRPQSVHDYKLPGLPGRGALLIRFGKDDLAFYLCILHLALGQKARRRQLEFIRDLINGLPRVVVMGDLNCEADSPEMQVLLADGALIDPVQELKTFPSWKPRRKLDHLLITKDLKAENVRAINFHGSDHLPVAMDIFVPIAMEAGA